MFLFLNVQSRSSFGTVSLADNSLEIIMLITSEDIVRDAIFKNVSNFIYMRFILRIHYFALHLAFECSFFAVLFLSYSSVICKRLFLRVFRISTFRYYLVIIKFHVYLGSFFGVFNIKYLYLSFICLIYEYYKCEIRIKQLLESAKYEQ